MIPVFIGFDSREVVAYHVLSHSLLARSSEPLAISPIGNGVLPAAAWWRSEGPHDSTEFSNARFMVPYLMGYKGWALFADCDMVCLADVAELWAQRDERYSVMCVKHDHKPTEKRKFLGAEQTRYRYKNWSSLMLLNCAHPDTQRLTPEYVNAAPGLDLHGFDWTQGEAIGSISGLWNVLVCPDLQHPEQVDRFKVKLLHYTLGGPWHGYEPEGTYQWTEALESMLAKGNPCASFSAFNDGPGQLKYLGQYQQRFSHDAP